MHLTMASILLFISLLIPRAVAQSPTANAEAALNVLNQWYDQGSGLFDTTGWWNSANAITALADLAAIDSNVVSAVTPIFSNTFTQAQTTGGTVVKHVDASGMIHSSYTPSEPPSMTHGSRRLAPRGYSGFINDYYDDEGWWALAWIAAYDLTQNDDYLNMAISIFNDMAGGWTTPCGGGIW